jgi:type III restriction enzyme
MFAYKEYQKKTLEALQEYLRLTREMGAKKAFVYLTERVYHHVEQLPDLPYVCLKVPTSGGKTVMACGALTLVAEEWLRQERCLALWLVPTEPIRAQTLRALRDRQHPYRQVLETAFEGRVTALDVEEALSMPRALLDSETVIIVSTLAAPRIGETDKRRLYAQNGSLMAHFDGVPDDLLKRLECYKDSDKPIPSLANVLKLRRPVVIMDEAHNARTELSFETLARFDPACILEFTATPAQGPRPNPSNVLCQVSASELKAEEMIKLPIHLETCADWQQTVLSAINKRRELETLAQAEREAGGSYLRPLVLLQAQKRNEELTVEVVYNCLKDLGVPEHEIAIETGERQDLKDKNVFSSACPVRYIITVDKLREGWDCAFAYVLCSVRDIGSRTAVEQVLGRVLRMPEAKRRQRKELNNAYAFVTSRQFADTARALDVIAEALEANGFTRFEARQEVEQTAMELGGLFGTLQRPVPPSERGERLEIPQLALWVDGEWEPVNEDHLLQADWNLALCDPALCEEEFSLTVRREHYDVDVNTQGRASVRWVEEDFAPELQA